MKIFVLLLLVCLILPNYSWSQNTTDTSTSIKERIQYRVIFAKMKPGQKQKAMAIGYKSFQKAFTQAGVEVEVYEMATGKWDALIMVPIKGQLADFDADPPQVGQNLVRLTGGEDQLAKLYEEYFSMVAEEQWQLGRKVVFE